MDYIYVKDNISVLVFDEKEEIITKSLHAYLRQLCTNHFFTMEGYFKAIRKLFGLEKRVPLFIDKNNIFVSLSGWRDCSLAINFCRIKLAYPALNGIKVIFQDGRTLFLEKSIEWLKRQEKKVNEIASFSEKNR